MRMHYLAFIVSSEVSAYLDKIIESVSLRSIQVHQITSEPRDTDDMAYFSLELL